MFFKNIIGIALYLVGTIHVQLQNVTFANNTYSGTSFVDAAVVEIFDVKNVTFIDCEIYNNLRTPISAVDSSLQFSGGIVFWNSTGYDGGAMSFTGESYVSVSNNTNVIFENNTADQECRWSCLCQSGQYILLLQTKPRCSRIELPSSSTLQS